MASLLSLGAGLFQRTNSLTKNMPAIIAQRAPEAQIRVSNHEVQVLSSNGVFLAFTGSSSIMSCWIDEYLRRWNTGV